MSARTLRRRPGRPARPVRRGGRAAARLAAPVVALGLTVLLAGCGTEPTSDGVTAGTSTGTSTGATSQVAGTGSAATTGGARTGTRIVPGPTGRVARTAPRALRPVRLQIPAIGVDASLTELGIGRGGAIEVPSDPAQAGWLDTTPAPGQQGPAVVAGHVDSTTGPAVFYRLRDLAVGDVITLTRRDGTTVRFTVDGVRTYRKSAFPTRAVYGPAPGPVLRLITCGGDYVKSEGGYLDNVVVYAS